MIEVSPLRIDEKTAIGLRVELPDSPPLLLIIGRTGFVGCGFINIDAAEKLNVAAATVTGVKSFNDILNAEVKAVTSRAQTKGVRVGMKGKEAVKLLL
ncbi:MAG: YunC family protein [Candidatus Bathyarchaeia archaeon]